MSYRKFAVLGIHINSIMDKNRQTKPLGSNPLDYLGLLVSDDGKIGKPTVWNGQKWIFYSDLDPFEVNDQPTAKRGKLFQLSHWFHTYDWVANEGYKNFSNWIE
jgi:hypothetical protein